MKDQITELDSGLRVVTVRIPHAVAHVEVFVRAGSRFDAPEDEGLSHFVEHMLHRGTARYPTSLELAKAAESVGSPINASSGRLDTSYSITVLPAAVPDAVEILAEMMLRPRFDDLELERALVIQELAEDYDGDGQLLNIDDLVNKAMFAGHPLAQTVLGPPGHVAMFTVADVRRHWRKHYRAQNMVLVVVGDVDHQGVVRAARRCFAGVTSGLVGCETVRPPKNISGPQIVLMDDGNTQVDISIAFRVKPRGRMLEWFGQVALVAIMDGGMAGPLHYTLADQRGLAYSVGTHIDSNLDVGVLEISAEAKPRNVPKVIEAVLEVVRGAEALVTPEALARASTAVGLVSAYIASNHASLATVHAMHVLHGDPIIVDLVDGPWRMQNVGFYAQLAARSLRAKDLVVACVGDVGRQRERIRRAVATITRD